MEIILERKWIQIPHEKCCSGRRDLWKVQSSSQLLAVSRRVLLDLTESHWTLLHVAAFRGGSLGLGNCVEGEEPLTSSISAIRSRCEAFGYRALPISRPVCQGTLDVEGDMAKRERGGGPTAHPSDEEPLPCWIRTTLWTLDLLGEWKWLDGVCHEAHSLYALSCKRNRGSIFSSSPSQLSRSRPIREWLPDGTK